LRQITLGLKPEELREHTISAGVDPSLDRWFPLNFVCPWFALITLSSDKSFRLRDRLSLLALRIASEALLLRFVTPVFCGSDFGDQVQSLKHGLG
jgi:hypothetical protein